MQKTILSLCDFSGQWAKPYRDAGYHVIQVDLKGGKYLVSPDPSEVTLIKSDVRRLEYLDGQEIYGIITAPPCQAFAGSGAQYWPQKDKNGETLAGLSIVDACLRAVALYQPSFWVLENPVGRLRRFIGPPRHTFDPCDYAAHQCTEPGWEQLPLIRAKTEAEEQLTPEEVQIVKSCNVYTKRTQLFGNFNVPKLSRVEPIRTSTQGSWTQLLGGKSERTKELRSETPAGFAKAFFNANQ